MWRQFPVVLAALVLTTASPKPYYQQHYQYQEQSESYKNNELQHKKEEAGRYSKIDDGVSKPLERKAFHQSEYHAPGSESQGHSSSLHNQNGGLAIPDITNQHIAQGGSRYLQTGSQNVQQQVPTAYRREWNSHSSYSSGQSSIPSHSQQISNGYSDSAVSGSQQDRVRSYSSHDQNYDSQNVGQRQGYYRQTSDNIGGISDNTSGNVADQRSYSYFNSGSNTNTNRQYNTDETVQQNPGLRVYPASSTGSGRVTHQTSRTYSTSQTTATNSDGTPAVYSVPQNSGIILVPVVPVRKINDDTQSSGSSQSRRTYSSFQSGSQTLNNDDTQKIYNSQNPSGVQIVPAVPVTVSQTIPVDQLRSGTTHQTSSRQYGTYQTTGTGSTNLKSSNTDDIDCDDDTTGTHSTSGTDRVAQSRRTYFVSGTADNLRPVGIQTNPTLPATSGTNVVTHQSRTNQQNSRSYTVSQPSVPQDYRPSRGPVPYPGYRGLSTTELPIEVEGPNSQPTQDQTSELRQTNRRVFHASSHVRVPSNTDQRPQQNEDDYDDLTQKNLDTDLTQQTQTGFDNDDLTQQPTRRRPNVNQDTSYATRQTQRTYQERTDNQNTPQYQPISSRPEHQPNQQTHRTSQRTYQQRVEKTEFADTPSTVKPDQPRTRYYPSQQTQTFDQQSYDQDLTQQHQTIDYSNQNRGYSQHADNQDARIPTTGTTGTNQGSGYSSSSSYSKSSSFSTQQQQQPQVVFSPVQVGNKEGKMQVFQTMQIPAGTSDEMRRQLEEQMRQQLELKMQELYSQQSSSYSSSSQKSQPSFSPLHVGRTGTGQLQVYQTVAIPAGASEETRQRLQQEMRQNLELKMRELMQQQGYQNIRHISTQPGSSDSTHIHSSGDGFGADCDEQTGGSYSTSYSMSSSSSSSSASGGGGNHYSMKVRPGSTYTIHQPVGSTSLYRSQK